MTSPYTRAIHLLAIIVCGLLFLLPLWWVTISALRPELEIFRYISPIGPWTLLPLNPTLENMIELWQTPFARAILNSLLLAALTVIFGLIVCAMAAFALAVMEFRGRNLIFSIVIVSFLLTCNANAPPTYGLMRSANLQNTLIGLLLPGLGNGLAIFLLRQFFLGIPRELREAAMVDGLGWFGLFLHIYLPLSVNALVAAAMMLFIGQWQAYLWPLLIAPAPEYKVASVAIAQFSDLYEVRYGLMFSAAVFVALIPMVILGVFQRYFNMSVASTGSKE